MKKRKLPEYIGRYRLCEKIARGGMATIYRATDEIIGRDVAIKITDNKEPSWENIDTNVVLRQFSMEAQISGQLSHHSFVTIYDAGMQGELCYMVMELLEGKTLSAVIKSRDDTYDMRAKLDLLIQVARALHHGHQRGILHRDIKPSNIMALPNGQAKVMDFGVAYVTEGSNIHLSSGVKNDMGGTPYYMSPEQIGKKELDGRSDLFSLAVVAYELLTGVRPFSSDKLLKLYEKILKSEPEPIRTLNAAIPEKVAAIINRCMNKNRELRLSSCLDFADKLDEIINENFFHDDGAVITEETLAVLRKYRESFSFFFDLDNQQIYKLLQVCQVKKFKKGDTIFEEGQVARAMYLIMSGRVKIVRGPVRTDSYVLHQYKRGEIFGEMGIIDGGPRSAAALADSDLQLLVVHQVSLLRCDDSTAAKIYRNFSQILSSKLRMTSSKLHDLSRHSNI